LLTIKKYRITYLSKALQINFSTFRIGATNV